MRTIDTPSALPEALHGGEVIELGAPDGDYTLTIVRDREATCVGPQFPNSTTVHIDPNVKLIAKGHPLTLIVPGQQRTCTIARVDSLLLKIG